MIRIFDYVNCKLVSSPYDAKMYLIKNLSDGILQTNYEQIIGSLIFLNEL